MTMKFADRVLHLAPEGALHMLVRTCPRMTTSPRPESEPLRRDGRATTRHRASRNCDRPWRRTPGSDEVLRYHRTRSSSCPAENPRSSSRPWRSSRRATGKPTLFFPTLALVQAGDEVIYPDPGFPTYAAMVGVAGGTPVPVSLREDEDFAFDLEAFDAALSDRTRMIVINSPSNPTGGVLSMSMLEHIAEAALRRDAWVLSDEIYSRLVFDGAKAPSIAELPGMRERTIICDGFSKTYAMTGWRLGYTIVPQPLAERLGLLLTHSVTCSATFTQYAALEAVTGPQNRVTEVMTEYQRRRDVMVAGLNAIPGVRCRMPLGAIYAFPNVKSFGRGSDWIANYLLEEAGVALLSGTAFGEGGEGYLRLCFASSMEDIKRGLDRIATALAKLG